MFLTRLHNEPRFAGSRAAPAGCIEYTTPGIYEFEWPEGVDRAVVFCRGAFGAGDEDDDGGGGAGGPATAERLVLKTDATAEVIVGSGGASAGADGGDSSFIQDSSVVEYCAAEGGKGGNGRVGGVGGQASNSYGTIKFSGGNGGNSLGSHDGGGGAGSSAGTTEDGNDGEDSDTQGAGGAGGAAPEGGIAGGAGGDEEENGEAPGGGAGSDGGVFGPGSGGYVSVCWEDPLPIGYCVDVEGSAGKRRWWPRCNHNCGDSAGGIQCFYYGALNYPDYFYPIGWPVDCCGGLYFPALLHGTIQSSGTVDCDNVMPNQTVPLYAVEPVSFHANAIVPIGVDGDALIPAWSGAATFGPDVDTYGGVSPTHLYFLPHLVEDGITPTTEPILCNLAIGTADKILSILAPVFQSDFDCDPIFLFSGQSMSRIGDCTVPSNATGATFYFLTE